MSSSRIGWGEQLRFACAAPASLFRLPAKTWGFFFIYLGLCAVVLGIAGALMARSEGVLKGVFLAYLLPESWRGALGLVVDRFFEVQLRTVIANATITGALLLVTLLLFPIKEMLSASFEKEAALIDDPVREHPLWLQAWEEVKLFLAFLAIQGSVFWIGYSPSSWRGIAANVVSYGFLFVSFSIDFVSPPLQRHEGCYSRILKTLFGHPIATVVFGAIFAAPSILVSQLILADSDLTSARTLGILFATAVASIAWAAVAGTWLGAKLFRDFEQTERSAVPARIAAWLVLGGLLLANAYAYGALGIAVHKKSQILKCDYSVAWSSFELETPGLGSLISRKVELGVSFEVKIENPTSVPVEVEDNRLELRHNGDLVGTGALRPVRVEAGATVTKRVGLELDVDVDFALRGRALLKREPWKLTLFLEVAPGLEFPIFLLD